eukprot:SAG22_NODE_3063_length_1970_cov_1.827365_3_plen_37_part_00
MHCSCGSSDGAAAAVYVLLAVHMTVPLVWLIVGLGE